MNPLVLECVREIHEGLIVGIIDGNGGGRGHFDLEEGRGVFGMTTYLTSSSTPTSIFCLIRKKVLLRIRNGHLP